MLAGCCDAWPTNMHKSLVVGIYLPLLRYRPWDWKQVPWVVDFCRALSKMFKEDYPKAWGLLRKFWYACLWIQGMPERLVCDLLSSPSWNRFLSVLAQR
jgi:hypothetical protein